MKIQQILSRHYCIKNARLTEVQPGWSALAYRVETDDDRCFLKVFDKTQYTAQSWIQAIDGYMPTVMWLGGHSHLRGRSE